MNEMRMPSNIEAEFVLLGALLSNNKLIDKVADIVTHDDFMEPLHGRIFSVIMDYAMKGKAVTPVQIAPLFRDDVTLQALGGNSYLAKLTEAPAIVPAVPTAQQIAELAQRRRLIEGLMQTMQMAADLAEPLPNLFDNAEAAIMASASHHDEIHQPTGGECIGEFIEGLKTKEAGVISRRVSNIDQLTGGLRRKQMVILAGRPGMGKTAVAISYSIGAAMNGHGVLFVSLEMSSQELGARMVADMACEAYDGQVKEGVLYDNLIQQKLNADIVREIKGAQTSLGALPFHVVDTGRLTVGRLAMLVKRYCRRFEAMGKTLDLVVVDYLQLLSPNTKGRSNYEAVSEISKELKAIAKDNGVAIMALAQLSREVEKRADKRPQLSDLRDSGQIEQDADTVMFLLRDEYYLNQIAEDERGADWQGLMADNQNRIEFICAKRRNGLTGSSRGYFYGAHQAVRGGQ